MVRLISVRKLHALPFILCCEFNSVHVDRLLDEENVINEKYQTHLLSNRKKII
jgi:hypothetical protein